MYTLKRKKQPSTITGRLRSWGLLWLSDQRTGS